MVTTEALIGARIPDQSDGPLGGLQIADAVRDIVKYVVPRFADAADREAAYAAHVAAGGTLSNGMSCWCDSPGAYYERVAGKWLKRVTAIGVLAKVEYLDVNPNNLNVPETALTIYNLATISNPGGRRLRLVHTVTLDSTGNTSTYVFRYRLGGTVIRESWMSMPFASVPETRTFTHVIEPAAGDLSLTITGERMAGAGQPRLLCDASKGPTQFYVEDIGGL